MGRKKRRRVSARTEGIRLGLIVASATWAWVALVDATLGHPYRTFLALGGVIPFTIAHYLLNITLGIVLAQWVRASERVPSLAIALTFGLVMFQVAFAMLTPLLGQLGLGNVAWVSIFGGSMIGTALSLALLNQRHPLVRQLHRAEAER